MTRFLTEDEIQNILDFIKPNKSKIITIEDCDELTGTTNEKILCDIYNRLINSSIYEINDLAHEVNNNNINNICVDIYNLYYIDIIV